MNKTIIITGASKGIGRAVSLKLAEAGHKLLLVGRSENDLKELSEECIKLNCECAYLAVDLVKPESAGLVINTCVEIFDGIDVLINNAGLANTASVENTPVEQWDLMMNVNARAPFLLCKKAIPHLKLSKQASIINISSVVGRKGYVNQTAYSASKHALTGFTKALAKELHPLGIRVHLVSPGGVATDMINKTRPDLVGTGLIQPSEIADIIEFLINKRGNVMIYEINLRRSSTIPFD
jgi:3-oxoacyl-[acyl-carrier protein] reductase